MHTLIVDNYDSYTYNLFQLIADVVGEKPTVVQNDELSWTQIQQLEFDNVVISPGPGTPTAAEDLGVCAEVLMKCQKPVLGVCLGHQGIGWAAGADVVRAPEPMHGRISKITHDDELFAGIPQGFSAVRYHSLALATPLPSALRAIAWSDDGVLMGVRRTDKPQWGVQYHPEAVCSQYGEQLVANFMALTGDRLAVA
ncbi:aminodeoxychorismate/anthranilate synthase component II [Streptomyces sp. NPDC002130]|uniref:anthranilate synthase component II n=1 Tax=Streptomyces sp. NPDC002130 TaxID=3155568 RepID=UPI003319336A